MKKIAILTLAFLAAVAIAVAGPVEAKRLGGGSSLGTQRQSIAPKPATPPSGAASQPVMPATPGATLPAKPALPAAAPASGMSRWLGPIAGIAAGLGLAALLSHFGLPEGLGSILLLALVVVAVIAVVRLLLARRTPAPAQPAMQYAGAAEPTVAPGTFDPAPAWGGAPKAEPTAPAAPAPRTLPPGFDAVGFAAQAQSQFRRLQAAWDTADRQALADVMTPDMFAATSRDLAARAGHQPTEVVALNAEVLEVATEGANHWASVRYTGLVREDGEDAPKPIDEVWNLTKPVDGKSGWLLAGIQQTA